MVPQISLLVLLVDLIDVIPSPTGERRRGRPPTYPDRLFLKALVIMLVRDVTTVDGLLAILGQPTVEMQALRERLTCDGRFPTRRTWERRLNALPATLPGRIACLGTHLVARLQPWADSGAAVAIDSTVLPARGGVWHKKDREAGVVPHSSIDTEAHWTKSGWHGWVYGWKLHLVVTVAAVWIPLAAELTAANAADNETAPRLLNGLPQTVRFVLGDTNYQDPALHDHCAAADRFLVATRRGRYPHTDDGVEVRRIFHKLRSLAIENLNGQFKGIFDVHGSVPTRGLVRTQRFALGAVFVYQVTLLYRFEHHQDLRVGLKAFLKAA
jgi:Transposase DDE domain